MTQVLISHILNSHRLNFATQQLIKHEYLDNILSMANIKKILYSGYIGSPNLKVNYIEIPIKLHNHDRKYPWN